MTLGFDQKEDLRLRMMELEKKLAESEEERSKLEKTCNILMRAFREEEKMRYKALNKKYEKFLEDCNLRKRRNDIILKSLCRIEDRARALLAKTERLKILKDRYVYYLKISDLKKVEPLSRNFPYVSASEKINHDVAPKSVHWKSPYSSDVIPSHSEIFEPEGSLFSNSKNLASLKTFDYELEKDTIKREENRINAGKINYETDSFDRLNRENKFYNDTPTALGKEQTEIATDRNERLAEGLNNERENIDEVEARRERIAVAHQESIEKLKKALSIDDDMENDKKSNNGEDSQNVIEKDEIEMNEKNKAAYRFDISNDAIDEDKLAKNPPVGLDGVDYQNETYPESYYEQPVHQNHASIASDVILEEDESEQDTDENGTDKGAKNVNSGQYTESENESRVSKTGQTSEPHPEKQLANFSDNELKFKMDDKDEQSAVNSGESNKRARQSNLMHLLESDTESFQIEHGDLATGNEDSDFDFSFN